MIKKNKYVTVHENLDPIIYKANNTQAGGLLPCMHRQSPL